MVLNGTKWYPWGGFSFPLAVASVRHSRGPSARTRLNEIEGSTVVVVDLVTVLLRISAVNRRVASPQPSPAKEIRWEE